MKRTIDTSIWSDPWFTELSANAKMVFMYLLTNERSTAAGIFDLSPRRMAFDMGIEKEEAEIALVELDGRVRWWPEHSIVWVVNFFRHQAVNDNFLKSAQRTFADLPAEIRMEVLVTYPEFDTVGSAANETGSKPVPVVSEPVPMGTEPVTTGSGTNTHIGESKEKELTGTGTDTEVKPPIPPAEPTAAAKPPDAVADQFAEFWSAYPLKAGKQEAQAKFRKVDWRKVEFADLMAALERHKVSAQWTKDGGQFVPRAATWLHNARWEDDLPKLKPPQGSTARIEQSDDPDYYTGGYQNTPYKAAS